jgi:hypothetical protein
MTPDTRHLFGPKCVCAATDLAFRANEILSRADRGHSIMIMSVTYDKARQAEAFLKKAPWLVPGLSAAISWPLKVRGNRKFVVTFFQKK